MELELIIGLSALVMAGVVGFLLARRKKASWEQLTDEADASDAPATPVTPAAAPTAPKSPADGSWFTTGLSRSREALSAGLSRALGTGELDSAALSGLEDVLIGADVGVRAAGRILESVRRRVGRQTDTEALKAALREDLVERLGTREPLAERPGELLAILVVGVNGSGKTTTIGKMAARYKRAGKKVILAAGDTFRAGAIEQLKVWGERADVPVVAHRDGADPAAVIFDSLKAASARGADVVICDTAGRLQAKKPLMEELGKVMRVMGKAVPGAPHEVLLVLDATIGQNALSQAKTFGEVVGVTGVALTKLDGTARGGVVIAVKDTLGLPVKLVGLGEGVDDLRDFEPRLFVEGLLGPAT